MLHREVTGRLRVVKTKEAIHYLNKLEKELTEKLGEIKGEMTYGALKLIWYKSYIDKEDILKEISWISAQLCILELAGIIKISTHTYFKEEVEKIYDDIWNMPI